MKRGMGTFFCLLAFAALAVTLPASAQTDILAVGTASGQRGQTVQIPVLIRDTGGTPLGVDVTDHIDNISATFVLPTWGGSNAVGSVTTVVRSGIAAGLTPIFETSVPGSTTASYLVAYPNAASISFNQSAPSPGEQVAAINFQIGGSTPNGTYPINIDPSNGSTVLAAQGNPAGTSEDTTQTGTRQLTLINGTITVTPVELASFSVE